MIVKAKAKFIRTSPRKVRLVTNLVSGMPVREASNQLAFSSRDAARPIKKLIDSATANATHNFGLDEDNLYIKKIVADEGPTLKRFRPRAQGRAYSIFKRTSHVYLELGEVKETKKTKKAAKRQAVKTVRKEDYEIGKSGKKETEGQKFEEEKGPKKKGLISKGTSLFKKRFFKRKSV